MPERNNNGNGRPFLMRFTLDTYLWAFFFSALFVLAGVVSSYTFSNGLLNRMRDLESELRSINTSWHQKVDSDFGKAFKIIENNQSFILSNQKMIQQNHNRLEVLFKNKK